MTYYAAKIRATGRFVHTGRWDKRLRLYPKLYRFKSGAAALATGYASRHNRRNERERIEIEIVEFEVQAIT